MEQTRKVNHKAIELVNLLIGVATSNHITVFDTSALDHYRFIDKFVFTKETLENECDRIFYLQEAFKNNNFAITNEIREEYIWFTNATLYRARKEREEKMELLSGDERVKIYDEIKLIKQLRTERGAFMRRVKFLERVIRRNYLLDKVLEIVYDSSYSFLVKNPGRAKKRLEKSLPENEANDEDILAKCILATYEFPLMLVTNDRDFQYTLDEIKSSRCFLKTDIERPHHPLKLFLLKNNCEETKDYSFNN